MDFLVARVTSPKLFSTEFGIDPLQFDKADLLDPFVNVDLPLFIDPTLLEKSTNKIISTEGTAAFTTYFKNVLILLGACEKKGDIAWQGAEQRLSLEEPAENGLGYSGSRRGGAARPEELRDTVLETLSAVLRMGSKNPEVVSLLGFFDEGVGPDTISDFTTFAIIEQLAKITEQFCIANKVPVHANDISAFRLPVYRDNDGKERRFILVPKDILRDLPMANDWSDVWAASFHNVKLRETVSALLAGIAKPTIAEQKEALKRAALSSPEVLDDFIEAVKAQAATYDPNEDALGYYKFRQMLIDHGLVATTKKYDLSVGPEMIRQVVLDAIATFAHHVEHGNLWEELWIGDKPKRERASQLLFYAIADAYCKANGIDINPEVNMGGGPVDFKFSAGYSARVVVEMKKSGGTVEHGYEKQLEYYKNAAATEFGIFVVMDYGDGDKKISRIMDWRGKAVARGERASDIIVIDASKKASASKRN